jgi:transcriptional regulator with XRE-family HTH domain
MEYKLNYALLGKRIRERRKSLKMTQEDIAEKAGISIKHISKIETGKSPPSLACFVSIANALDTTLDRLLMDNLTENTAQVLEEVKIIFDDFSPIETHIAVDLLKALKFSVKTRNLCITEIKN